MLIKTPTVQKNIVIISITSLKKKNTALLLAYCPKISEIQLKYFLLFLDFFYCC